MSRSSSPCTLQNAVTVPTNTNGSSRSINSLSGTGTPTPTPNLFSGSAGEMSGSSDGVSTGGAAARRPGARRMSMQDAIDVSKFDMKLYSERRRKNTLTLGDAIHEEARESEHPHPHLDLSLRYDKDTRSLCVHLIGASDLQELLALAASSAELDVEPGQLNPYCRVQLLPDQQSAPAVFHGKVHKNTAAPQFDEHFVFDVDSSEIGLKVLLITVMHDEPARAPCLAHALFSLSNLQFNQSLTFRRALVCGAPKPADSLAPCCILFSLAYLVGAERITATIAKVTNLRYSKGKVQCKIVVTTPDASPKKKKTSAMRIVNETAELQEALTFTVNRKVINQTKVRIELFQKGTFQKARVLGWLELGPNSTGYAYAHWNDMVNGKDNLPRWHQLSPTLEKNNNSNSNTNSNSNSSPTRETVSSYY